MLFPAGLSARQVYTPASDEVTLSIRKEPRRIIAYGDKDPLSRDHITETSDSGDV